MPEYIMRMQWLGQDEQEITLEFPITGQSWFAPNGEFSQERARKHINEMKKTDKTVVFTFFIKNDDCSEKEIPILNVVE